MVGQIIAFAGHAVSYEISSIFKHILDRVKLYFTSGHLKRKLSLRRDSSSAEVDKRHQSSISSIGVNRSSFNSAQ